MYCRQCGASVPEDAAFCPRCGARQSPGTLTPARDSGGGGGGHGIPTWVLIFLLLVPPFLPLGLLLMWTLSGWKFQTKVAITAVLLVLPVTFWLHVPGLIAVLALIAVIAGLSQMWQRTTGAPRDAESRNLERIIESKLDTCHDLIARIEGTGAPSTLDSDAPALRRYQHALEMRSEGIDLYERALDHPDLVAADARLTRAMDELRSAHDEMTRSLA